MDHAARRRDLLAARPDAAAVAVTPGPSLRYLTGYQFNRDAHGHDAPFLYLLRADGEAGAVLPELETDTAGDALDAALYTYETPAGAEAAVADLLADLDPGAPLGVEEHRLRLLELDLLAARWDRPVLVPALVVREDGPEVAWGDGAVPLPVEAPLAARHVAARDKVHREEHAVGRTRPTSAFTPSAITTTSA